MEGATDYDVLTDFVHTDILTCWCDKKKTAGMAGRAGRDRQAWPSTSRDESEGQSRNHRSGGEGAPGGGTCPRGIAGQGRAPQKGLGRRRQGGRDSRSGRSRQYWPGSLWKKVVRVAGVADPGQDARPKPTLNLEPPT